MENVNTSKRLRRGRESHHHEITTAEDMQDITECQEGEDFATASHLGQDVLYSNGFYLTLQHHRNGISCINSPKVSQEKTNIINYLLSSALQDKITLDERSSNTAKFYGGKNLSADVIEHWNRCPEYWRDVHPWRCSKLNRTKP